MSSFFFALMLMASLILGILTMIWLQFLPFASALIGGTMRVALETPLDKNTIISSSLKPLQFTEEGTFQLSIFEDLHYGEGEFRA